LEWVGLGAFIATVLAAGTQYAQAHLGSDVGQFLVEHLTKF
jgi:hypothetical protein